MLEFGQIFHSWAIVFSYGQKCPSTPFSLLSMRCRSHLTLPWAHSSGLSSPLGRAAPCRSWGRMSETQDRSRETRDGMMTMLGGWAGWSWGRAIADGRRRRSLSLQTCSVLRHNPRPPPVRRFLAHRHKRNQRTRKEEGRRWLCGVRTSVTQT
jgi:hypothetical protein